MVPLSPGATIGIIGGGQLGRMTAQAAAQLGYKTHVYSDITNSPASFVTNKTTVAPYTDEAALRSFAESVSVATVEFENIPHESIKLIESIVSVSPGWNALHIAQNRQREKDYLNSIDVATTKYQIVRGAMEFAGAVRELSPPCILKTVELGYDGKGQRVIDDIANLPVIWEETGISIGIVEKMVPFEKEISVIVARTSDAVMECFPPVQNVHMSGILDTSVAPADISPAIAEEAQDIAKKIAESLQVVGLLTVEFFLVGESTLLVNELAPRPHNSGHWTMDGCVTTQFEQLVRAICGLPLGSVHQHTRVMMQNLIGSDVENWEHYFNERMVKIHLYGKDEVREGRKMGHINWLRGVLGS